MTPDGNLTRDNSWIPSTPERDLPAPSASVDRHLGIKSYSAPGPYTAGNVKFWEKGLPHSDLDEQSLHPSYHDLLERRSRKVLVCR